MLLKCSSEHENENKKCEFIEVAQVLTQAHGNIISKHTLLAIRIITLRCQKHICEFYIKCVLLLPT